MQHVDMVIKAAQEGFQTNVHQSHSTLELVYWTKELEQLLRAVYRAGYNEHRRQQQYF